MTSDSDDLEKALQENLKLRSELATKVVKAEAAASQRGGMAYRLGWVLYWGCFALAVAVFVVGVARFLDPTPLPLGLLVLLFWLPALILYGLGRAFRYVLSGG